MLSIASSRDRICERVSLICALVIPSFLAIANSIMLGVMFYMVTQFATNADEISKEAEHTVVQYRDAVVQINRMIPQAQNIIATVQSELIKYSADFALANETLWRIQPLLSLFDHRN